MAYDASARQSSSPLGLVDYVFEVERMRFEMATQTGMFALMGIPSAAFWLDPSLNRMLSPLADEVGIEMFRLLIAWSSSLGTEEDYEAMVTVFAKSFDEGFLQWGRAVGSIGWGHFELPAYEPAQRRATVVVRNTWELQLQHRNANKWGCPFIQGKLIGLFSVAFGTPCWATERDISYEPDNQFVIFDIAADDRTIHAELDRLRGAQAEERNQARRRLAALQFERDVATRANEAKSRFLASMSHELRTPINAILGYTEMVRDELRDRGFEDSSNDLQRVVDASNHLVNLVSQVLHLSRIEANQEVLSVSDVDVEAVVDQVIRMVRQPIQRNGNQLVVALDALDGLVLRTDETKLVQILVNLLGNAGKFTWEGTVTLRASLTDSEVTLAVRDTGVGIPRERQAAIFDMFTQADHTIQHRYGGVGLGLSISRQLTTALGGTLDVESEEGEGSTFTLRLPRNPNP